MPRVSLNKEQYMKNDLIAYIRGRMEVMEIYQTEMGELLGITQQGFGYRLRNCLFTQVELAKIFKRLGTTDEEILKFLKI